MPSFAGALSYDGYFGYAFDFLVQILYFGRSSKLFWWYICLERERGKHSFPLIDSRLSLCCFVIYKCMVVSSGILIANLVNVTDRTRSDEQLFLCFCWWVLFPSRNYLFIRRSFSEHIFIIFLLYCLDLDLQRRQQELERLEAARRERMASMANGRPGMGGPGPGFGQPPGRYFLFNK